MAPKRLRSGSCTSSPRKQETWTREDSIELLSRLDFAISEGLKSRALFEEANLKHQEQNPGRVFKVKETDRNFRKLWHDFGWSQGKTYAEIYIYGSRCLDGISDHTRKKIQQQVGVLQDEAYAKRLGSPRQTRSRRADGDLSSTRHISLSYQSPRSVTPKKRGRPDAPGQSKLSSSPVASKRKLESCSDRESPETPCRPTRSQSTRVLRQLSPPGQCVVDSEDGNSFIEERSESAKATVTQHGRQAGAQSGPDKDEERLALDTHRLPTRNSNSGIQITNTTAGRSSYSNDGFGSLRFRTNLVEQQSQLQDSEDGLLYFQSKLIKVEKKLVKTEKKLKRLECVFFGTENAHAKLEREGSCSYKQIILAQEREIEILNMRLKDKQNPYFASLGSRRPLPFDTGKVQTEMTQIRRQLQNIMSCRDLPDVPSIVDLEGLDQIQSLLCRALGCDTSGGEVSAQIRSRAPHTDIRSLICSLIAASLCEWVFNSDLILEFTSKGRLLELYRKHLAEQASDLALQNLDFAAHRSLYETEFFQQHIITKRASELATCICAILEPLLSRQAITEQWPASVIQLWHEEHRRLQGIYASALRVKAEMVVHKDLFEAIMFPPGAPFSETAMEIEYCATGSTSSPSQHDLRVKLSMLPGLRAFKHDCKLVDNHSFALRARLKLGEPTNITKTVVIVESVADHNDAI